MAKSVAEQIIDNAIAGLTLIYPSLSSDTGEKFTATHARPQRVVGVPRGVPGELRQPDRHGDGNFATVGRILLLRDFMIHWEVWDLSFGATEDLYLELLRTLRNQNHNSVTFHNETWPDQEAGQDGWDKLGTVIEFDSIVVMPVYEHAPIRVQLTHTPQITTTVKLPSDGSGETNTINQGTP